MFTRSEAIFDVDNRRQKAEALNQKRLDPDFWNDPEKARIVEMEIATEESWVNDYDALVRRAEDVETLLVLADEEDDADLAAEIESECERLVEDLADALKTAFQNEDYRTHRQAFDPGAQRGDAARSLRCPQRPAHLGAAENQSLLTSAAKPFDSRGDRGTSDQPVPSDVPEVQGRAGHLALGPLWLQMPIRRPWLR